MAMSALTEQVKPPHIDVTTGRSQEQILTHRLSRNLFKVGDRVAFKKPKRNKIRGTIDHIAFDVKECFWTDGGTVPRYIRVAIPEIDKDTGEILKVIHVWTSENKLTWGITG
jgi:hypothetical protein